MKKSLKCALIILGSLISIIVLDTIQAKVFNSSPLLRVRKYFDGGRTYYIDKGLFVNHYHCNNEKVTTWACVKFACSLRESKEKTFFNYSKVIDNEIIELNIPNTWKYEELPLEDNYKLGLKIYKEDKENYFVMYYYTNPFGVCGTGRKTKTLNLDNGSIASVGYYDNSNIWSDVSFYDINKNIAFINYETNDNEAWEIIKTFNIEEH